MPRFHPRTPAALAALAAAAAFLHPASALAHPAGSPSLSSVGVLLTKKPASPTNRTTARFAWKLIGHATRAACRLVR